MSCLPVAEDIAPRILFAADGGAASVLPDLAASLAAAPGVWEQPAEAVREHAAANAEPVHARTLVVVDAAVTDHPALLADLARREQAGEPVAWMLLDAQDPGVERIAERLAGDDGPFDAIHLITHGEAGRFALGADLIDRDTLLMQAPGFAQWSAGLTAQADILVYGCDVAADEDGRQLIAGLAALTGADVAASEDDTGSPGNWILEHESGAIDAPSIVTTALAADWLGTLALQPPVSPEIRVSQVGENAAPTAPSGGRVAATGGDSVVVWEEGVQILMRQYSDGVAQPLRNLGGTLLVQTSQPTTAMGPGGDFAIAFTIDLAGGGGDTSIWFSRYAADGQQIGSASAMIGGSSLGSDATDPVIAARNDGGYVVAWTQGNGGDNTLPTRSIRLDVIEPDGTMRVRSVDNQSQAPGQRLGFSSDLAAQNEPVIAVDPNTNDVMLAHIETRGGNPKLHLTWLSEDRTERRVGYVDLPNAAAPAIAWRPMPASPAGGEFAVSFFHNDDGQPTVGMVSVGASDLADAPNGQPFVATAVDPRAIDLIEIDRVAQTSERGISIASGVEGTIVAWRDGGGGGGADILARHIGTAWQLLGESAERLNTVTSGDQVRPALALSDGAAGPQLIATWEGNGPGGADGVFRRDFELTSPRILVSLPEGQRTFEAPNDATTPGQVRLGVRLDAEPSDSVTYEFVISPNTSAGGSPSPLEITIDPADWEKVQYLTLDGDPAFAGEFQVEVTLESNDPAFDESTTGAIPFWADGPGNASTWTIQDGDAAGNAVDEHAAVGTAVGIRAEIAPAAGTATFELVDPATPFAIDAATGEVTVQHPQSLDFEDADEQILAVRATDAFGNSAVRSFTITVRDVDEEPDAIDGSLSFDPASPRVLDPSHFQSINDALGGPGQSIRIDTLPVAGDLWLREPSPGTSTTVVTAGQTITLAAIAEGRLSYRSNDVDASTPDTIVFSALADPAAALPGRSATLTMTPQPVAPAPLSIVAPAIVDAIEDQQAVPFAGNAAIDLVRPGSPATLELELTVARGTLEMPQVQGLQFIGGTQNGTGNLRVTGSDEDVARALGSLLYRPATDDHGSVALGIRVEVLDGAQQSQTATHSIEIRIAAVNDLPTVSGTLLLRLDSDLRKALGTDTLAASDVETTAEELVLEVVTAPQAGKLLLDDQPLAAGATFAQSALQAGRIAYERPAGAASVDRVVFAIIDGAGARLENVNLLIELQATPRVPEDPPPSTTPSSEPSVPAPASAAANAGSAAESTESDSAQTDRAGGGDRGIPVAHAPPPRAASGSGSSAAGAATPARPPDTSSSTNPHQDARDRTTEHRIETVAYQSTRDLVLRATNAQPLRDASASSAYARAEGLLRDPVFLRSIAQIDEQARTALDLDRQIIATSVVATGGLSIGYVIWLLRGGALLSSMLASMPAWRLVDPLPVLATLDGRRDAVDDVSLQEMVSDSAATARSPRPGEVAQPDERDADR